MYPLLLKQENTNRSVTTNLESAYLSYLTKLSYLTTLINRHTANTLSLSKKCTLRFVLACEGPSMNIIKHDVRILRSLTAISPEERLLEKILLSDNLLPRTSKHAVLAPGSDQYATSLNRGIYLESRGQHYAWNKATGNSNLHPGWLRCYKLFRKI